MKEFFVDRDINAIERYWHESYVQHNPSMKNGHQGLRDILTHIDPGFKWIPGIFIESNDIVISHSQVHGWGPVPLIVVDIFRFEDGKIAEHWDVVQEEVPASKTASGNPMTSLYQFWQTKNNLIGKKFLAHLGDFKAELFFESEASLIFKVAEGGGPAEQGHTEKVQIVIAEIRPQVYMVAWKEATGATVTHIEDHENGILYSNATLPNGTFYPMKGTIRPLQN